MSNLASKELRKTTNPAFRFIVNIDGKAIGAFTECTLPTIEWEMKEVKAGGLNTHTVQVPGRHKKSKLVLKNGVGLSRKLMNWYLLAVQGQFIRKRVTVILRNSASTDVMRWVISDCVPAKWTGPQLKSDAKAVAIQTLELVCGQISVERPLQQPSGGSVNTAPHVVPAGKRRVQNNTTATPHVTPPAKRAFQSNFTPRRHVVPAARRATKSLLAQRIFL